MNKIKESNSLDPDQARQNVGPALGPICLKGYVFLLRAYFFKICFFQSILSEILSKCQTVWIQIRPDKMSAKNLV